MKKILFRFEANEKLGMGHAFRCTNIINVIHCKYEHRCVVAISNNSSMAFDLLKENNIEFLIINNDRQLLDYVAQNDIYSVVNDLLNTESSYIQELKKIGCKVINLEDEGAGSKFADVVINELYEKADCCKTFYYGQNYYCLPQSMLCAKKRNFNENVSAIALLFGNTDPSHLTEKCILALNNSCILSKAHLFVVVGKANTHLIDIDNAVSKNKYFESISILHGGDLAIILDKVDVAISSQGRTIFELAHYCIPSVIMAQNERETLHTFASVKNGFINLGLGSSVSNKNIVNALELICESTSLRKNLYDSMSALHLEQGINRVIDLILN